MTIQRIALTTGGGDAPGLNAVIRAVTLASLKRGWDVLGIRNGYDGLLFPEDFGEQGGILTLTQETVRGLSHLGGTILGTTNRGNPFRYEVKSADGTTQSIDISYKLLAGLQQYGIDAIVSIGGDGSMMIAHQVAEMGVRVVGVPKTIDNDLVNTVVTFGFDSAVDFATECIGRLHTTAESHRRVMIVEVMGRNAGWIALHAGLAGTADVILIPEIPYNIDKVVAKIEERNARGRDFSIIVIAEGAYPQGGSESFEDKGGVKRLSGAAQLLTDSLRARVSNEVRFVVLGHLLRGGSPTPNDRILSLRFGAAAVRALEKGLSNVMVSLEPPHVRYVPLDECVNRTKVVPLDCDAMLTAYDFGVEFGA